MGAIIGPGGNGKTILAQELAIAVASGHDITGGVFQIRHVGPVLYFQAEDPEAVLHNRFHALGAYLPPATRDILYEHLYLYPVVGLDSKLIDRDLSPTSFAGEVKSMATGARLVIFDTLRRFHNLEENNSGAMSAVVGVMENISRETGAAVLFVHHANKLALTSDTSDMQQAIRGSSAITDNIRWQGNLASDKESGLVRLVVAKNNYGPPTDDIWLRRERGGVLVMSQPPEEKRLKLVKPSANLLERE
ncbi:MAG: helicase RepA family protein [Peptococcaceae bacterium]|nr:helicase RepA family protein [Peptococcaceae bacterium]